MTDLTALIARLEVATGPDRLLDRDIGVTVLGWQNLNGALLVDGNLYPDHPGAEYPSPTESVDIALTLVPEGFCSDTQSLLRTTTLFGRSLAWAQVEEINGPIIESAKAPTLPLAIVIAALKARAAQESPR